MLLSICIPSYNRGHRAVELVKKLLAMPYGEDEIEILCSNNGSDKFVEEYKELSQIEDKRYRYHEFTENQGFAVNINQVIKMSRGDFCMLLSDEDELVEENLRGYMGFLKLHPELSLMKGCTSLAYSDMETLYISDVEEAIDAYYMLGNYISGTIYNRKVITNELLEEFSARYKDNEAYYYYIHLFLDTWALLHGNYCSSDLLLVVEGIPADSFDIASNSPDSTVPVFGTYESRIAQMHGFVEQIRDLNVESSLASQMLIRVLKRITEQIGIQKKKYISHGDDWEKIMELLVEEMQDVLLDVGYMLGKEDMININRYIQTIMNCKVQSGDMKEAIVNAIQTGDTEAALTNIKEYEKKEPEDFELYSYYVSYYLMVGNYEDAMETAGNAVRRNPFDIESNYNYAVCSEQMGDIARAYDYYNRTQYLQQRFEQEVVPEEELKERMNQLCEMAKKDENCRNEISMAEVRYTYAVSEPFRDAAFNVVGSFITDSLDNMYYVGRCDGWYESYWKHELNRNVCTAKCEMFPVQDISTDFTLDTKGEKVLLPIVMNYIVEDNKNNILTDETGMENEWYWEQAYCKYIFIPVIGKSKFHCKNPAVFAKPIPLRQQKDSEHKRLVLNLFVDSFNWNIVEKYGLKTLMPNTYQFFSKGMICSNYYSCAEYTHPSIATYWTGKYPSHHMNIDEKCRWDFMGNQKGFAEYFKEMGYVTAKIGGNDSVTPTQGYIRGMDRFVYQNNAQGLTVKEVVSDAIEHMQTFHETNQFLWLDIVDLHHVAGRFMRSLMVQAECPFGTRVVDNNGGNSVKQDRSLNQEKIYIKELKKVDLYLSLLYQYICENYKDDEILISLFSDHGTAFLVDNDQPFMSKQRCNVPLFIRGSGVEEGVCEEIISAADYAGIMCKLSGIQYDYKGTDANLPVVFGGEKEREYAFCQSIFWGDPYQAGFHGKDFHCYFTTEKPVEKCFRIDLAGSHGWCLDDEGKDITDEVDIRKYKDVFQRQVGHLVQYSE